MSARTLTLAGYGVIVVVAAAWGAVTATRPGLGTLRQAVDALTRTRLTRSVVLLGWAWIGWHLFVRTTVFD